jgi:hypothetical protein
MIDPSMNTVRNKFLERVVTETFCQPVTEQDTLLLMALLHMYRVILSHPIAGLDKSVTYLEALTQRSAAIVVAASWHGVDTSRSTYWYWYWYWKWNADWRAYEHLEELSPTETQRLRELKRLLESHPAVRWLEPEDWDFVQPDTVRLDRGERVANEGNRSTVTQP